jgi:hypothetical protein
MRARSAIGLVMAFAWAAWAEPSRGAEMRLQRIERHGYRLTLPEAVAGSWREANIARLQVRIPRGAGRLDHGLLPAGRELDFAVDAPGCSMVQVDVGPASARGASDAWQRVTHCTKFVLCADTGDPAVDLRARRAAGQLLTAKSGSRIEIRPLFNPAALIAGAAFPVRLYAGGRAVAGGGVEAIGAEGGRVSAVADAHGIAVLTIPQPGAWRLRFSHQGRVAELVFDALSR